MDERAIDKGRPPKVLITKIGFDGHDRGSRIVATFLRDAGMEVVYTGPWQTVSSICNIALQEDVDVIGVSSLAADHLILPKLMNALREAELGHIKVVVGGIIPDSETGMLISAGVSRIFHPGATKVEIVEEVAALAAAARRSAAPLEPRP
jgi:methylmalonyl-CoA mutase C-terminal domain/subunit